MIVRNGRGVSVLQGLILAAVYIKYRSVGMTTAGELTLSNSSPKIEFIDPRYEWSIYSGWGVLEFKVPPSQLLIG